MAKQYVSSMGGFSGRLGQVVGYQWNGRWCLRVRPAVVRNPRTELQQTARALFSGGVQLAARMRWAVMEGLRTVARQNGMTAYNAFCSLNQHAFAMEDGVFSVDYPTLRLSTGPVAPVAVSGAVVDDRNVLEVSFEKNPMHMRADSVDMVHVYVYSPEMGEGYLAAAVYRSKGRVAVALDERYAGQRVHIYAFVSDTAGRCSETAYGGEVRVESGEWRVENGEWREESWEVRDEMCEVGGEGKGAGVPDRPEVGPPPEGLRGGEG